MTWAAARSGVHAAVTGVRIPATLVVLALALLAVIKLAMVNAGVFSLGEIAEVRAGVLPAWRADMGITFMRFAHRSLLVFELGGCALLAWWTTRLARAVGTRIGSTQAGTDMLGVCPSPTCGDRFMGSTSCGRCWVATHVRRGGGGWRLGRPGWAIKSRSWSDPCRCSRRTRSGVLGSCGAGSCGTRHSSSERCLALGRSCGSRPSIHKGRSRRRNEKPWQRSGHSCGGRRPGAMDDSHDATG